MSSKFTILDNYTPDSNYRKMTTNTRNKMDAKKKFIISLVCVIFLLIVIFIALYYSLRKARNVEKSILDYIKLESFDKMYSCQHDFPEGSNHFGDRLMLVSHREGNLAASVWSISTLMAMMYTAAHGKTAREIKNSMTFPCDDNFLKNFGNFNLLNNYAYEANGFYYDKSVDIMFEFKNKSQKHFGIVPTSRDFKLSSVETRNEINAWISNQTNGKINDLIDRGSITPDTKGILINAVYFRGQWKYPFDKRLTTLANFYVSRGAPIQVPTMGFLQIVELRTGYSALIDSDIAELPFLDNKTVMILILPRKNYDLHNVEINLVKHENGSFYDSVLETGHVDIRLPKFSVETTLNLKTIFKKIGVNNLFNSERADLNNFGGAPSDFHVTNIFQKTIIEVDEADTSERRRVRNRHPDVKLLEFNKPFIYVIRDNTYGANLLMGRVVSIPSFFI